MSYNPVEDCKKQFTLEEWAEVAKSEIDDYVKTWKDRNEFHKNKNRWSNWMNSFIQYMSW